MSACHAECREFEPHWLLIFMSNHKKMIRKSFRDSVFQRDMYRCKTCGFDSKKDEALIDAHHITDRNEMPNGGYVKENGITLCHPCHEKAESFHKTGISLPGFSIEELYKKINSTLEIAKEKSNRLGL